MKKMKVYLQYPWRFPDSPYYKYLVQDSPKGVEYLNTKREKGAVTKRKNVKLLTFVKVSIRRYANRFRLNILNAHKSPSGNYDLIHCAHCLSKNRNKPWVADVESGWSIFIGGDKRKSGQNKARKVLLRENCKKILPWTEETKREYLETYPEIKNKIEVVYPAVPEIKNLKKPKNKKLKIIFIARFFHLKGGLVALETLERLRKKYDIEGIVVSDVPEDLKKKYSNLKIYDLMSQEKLFKLMQSSDIFFYPCPHDTFGFSLLEAMSFGMPIISIDAGKNTSTRKEIVENEKHGFLIDARGMNIERIGEREEKIVKDLVDKNSELIENKKLREKISRNCLKEISSGKFSIKERNKKLERIYSEALR